MRIIDVAEFYTDQGGGVKTYINQKLKAGARLGHEIIIIAPGRNRGVEERLGGKVYWVPGPPLPVDPRYVILWRQKEVHRLLDELKPDVVEGSSPWTGGWFAANWKGKAVKSFIFHQDPVAVYPHTILGKFMSTDKVDSLFGFYWNYLKKLSCKFDATIVSGQWLADRTANFGIKNPIPVPFGIDKDFFSPKRRDPELRKNLLGLFGLPETADLFIGISRHHPEKRLATMIDGFSLAAKEKPMALILFGDGPLRFYVNKKVKKSLNVSLMGFTSNRDELANIMASCDYFLHGSAAETYGLVIAEALCSGLPIVVPNKGGSADLARQLFSETYEAGNKEELKKAVLSITKRDRNSLRDEALNHAEKHVGTMDSHFENLFKVYEDLVKKNKILK
jgi:alpha-1,6-mannosyltransferase